MMRITNSMIVNRTKTNINANRAYVDRTNNQMASQKKITKPSDDPVIAIRALRLRSTLSTITQYHDRNITDAESWMDCTQTALINMNGILDDAYKEVVYGATDSLQLDNRRAILKSLESLQQQVYHEGNADYAGRTIFTGYKTDGKLTFTNMEDAKAAHYQITERFTYQNIEQKNYYAGRFTDTSVNTMAGGDPKLFEEVSLSRIRLAYDNITQDGNSLNISYGSGANKTELTLSADGTITIGKNCKISMVPDGTNPTTNPPTINVVGPYQAVAASNGEYSIYHQNDMVVNGGNWVVNTSKNPVPVGKVQVRKDAAGEYELAYDLNGTGTGNSAFVSYRVTDTSTLRNEGYKVENEIVFDRENGELLFSKDIADRFSASQMSFKFAYDKSGFDEGELRPENYFECHRYMPDRREPIYYKNYDENDNWITEGIFYNVAAGQQMQINTEAREAFNSDIRRDIDDLIEVVQMAISAQQTVTDIETKIKSGVYSDTEIKQMNKWLDAANKQLDYANQNMHDTYSRYITKFQGYQDKVDLEVTDLGSRGQRIELTKNRMAVQKTTFKELKSINEDMDLSDLVINYTAATVAYQSALQAGAKIGKMTLLDYI